MAVAVPSTARPVNPTSPTVYGGGTTNKSLAATAFPAGVERETRPEPAFVGTLINKLLLVAEDATAPIPFTPTRSLASTGSKLEPLIAIDVKAVAMFGVKEAI